MRVAKLRGPRPACSSGPQDGPCGPLSGNNFLRSEVVLVAEFVLPLPVAEFEVPGFGIPALMRDDDFGFLFPFRDQLEFHLRFVLALWAVYTLVTGTRRSYLRVAQAGLALLVIGYH